MPAIGRDAAVTIWCRGLPSPFMPIVPPGGPPSGWYNKDSGALVASSTQATPYLGWQSLRAPIPWL